MLSKLLSKVGNSEAVSLQEGSKSSGENAKGLDSSKKVFQSLLSALQGEAKGNGKNLIKLADGATSQPEEGSSKNADKLATVLGGHFSSLQKSTEGEAKNSNTVKESAPNIEVSTVPVEGQQESENTEMKSEQPESQVEKQTKTGEGKQAKKVATESSKEKVKVQVDAKQGKATKTEAAVVKDSAKGEQTEESQSKGANTVSTEKKNSENVKEAPKTIQTEKVAEGEEKSAGEEKEKPGKVSIKKGPSVNFEEKTTSRIGGKKDSLDIVDKTDKKQNVNATSPEIKKTAEGASKAEFKGETNSQPEKANPETIEKKGNVDLRRSKAGVKREQLNSDKRASLEQKLKKQPRSEATVNNRRNLSVNQTDNQRKPVENFFQKNSTLPSEQKGLEFKSMQVDKMRKKQKDSDRKRSNIDKRGRNPELNRIGFSGRLRQQSLPPLSSASTSDNTFLDSSSSAWKEDLVWENQLSESGDMKENQDAQKSSSASSTMRLGQMPVSNINLRKEILPGLTKTVTQAASEAQKTPDQWQKHNFVLDDGKNIQLSVRESKGVLHVKMGSLNMDLSKLLQQNMQQIREHLEQEFGTDVNLQFENQDQHQSEFSEDSESSNNEQSHPKTFTNNELAVENTAQIDLESIRRFGYNQMEWTA